VVASKRRLLYATAKVKLLISAITCTQREGGERKQNTNGKREAEKKTYLLQM